MTTACGLVFYESCRPVHYAPVHLVGGRERSQANTAIHANEKMIPIEEALQKCNRKRQRTIMVSSVQDLMAMLTAHRKPVKATLDW